MRSVALCGTQKVGSFRQLSQGLPHIASPCRCFVGVVGPHDCVVDFWVAQPCTCSVLWHDSLYASGLAAFTGRPSRAAADAADTNCGWPMHASVFQSCRRLFLAHRAQLTGVHASGDSPWHDVSAGLLFCRVAGSLRRSLGVWQCAVQAAQRNRAPPWLRQSQWCGS